MSEWIECTLGEIANVQTGPFGSQLHASDYVDFGIPSIMPKDIGQRLNINLDSIAYITEEDAQRLDKYRVKQNDLVFSRRGDVEKCAFITGEMNGWLCGTGCLKVEFFPNAEVVPQFMAYYFSTRESKHWLTSHAVGTTMPNLNSTILGNFPLELPTLPEQKAITAVLAPLDDKIDLLHRQNKTLESMAQTLFRHWFMDETAVDWEEKPLQDVLKIAIGRTPPRKESQWFSTIPSDMKWVSIKDLGSSGVFIFDTSEYLTMEAVQKFNIPVIPENTVVLSFKMTVGRVGITTEPMTSNEAIAHFKFNENTPFAKEYLYFFLKLFRYEELGSTSSIVTAINSQMIKEMKILIPDATTMTQFAETVSVLFDKIKKNQSQIRTLEKLRDTLLPKLMSGEVRVRL